MKRIALQKLHLNTQSIKLLTSEALAQAQGGVSNTIWGGCSNSCTNPTATQCNGDQTEGYECNTIRSRCC